MREAAAGAAGAAGGARYAKSDYGAGPGYWDQRYAADPKPYEWLRGYGELEALLEKATSGDRGCRILNVGCGNSLITEELYDKGYHDITNIDNSAVAVTQMAARNAAARPEMRWLEMDATRTAFGDRSFDMVLDKALLDTLATMPGAVSQGIIQAFVTEILRVLVPGGALLSLSFGNPPCRQRFLGTAAGFGGEPSIHTLAPLWEHGASHYVYLSCKGPDPGPGEPPAKAGRFPDWLDCPAAAAACGGSSRNGNIGAHEPASFLDQLD